MLVRPVIRFFSGLVLAVMLAPLAAACSPASQPAPPATSAPAQPTTAPQAGQPTVAPATKTGAQPAAGTPKRGGIVRIGISQEPIVLNRLLNAQTVNSLVGEVVLEGLVRPLADGNYEPELAEEVPTTRNGGVSADGKTITWKLKKGVLWSDGRPFTAKDVIFTYNVIINPQNPIIDRTGYSDIESLTAPDDHTVVVQYKQPFPGYKDPHFYWVLPEHAFGGDTLIDKKDYNRAPIGTGPFRFKSWASGDTIEFDRNPNYREQGKPYIDGVLFKVVPSREAAIQAFKVNEIDVLWNLIEANIPEFEQMQDAVAPAIPSDRVERLILNVSCPDGPQQGDPSCLHPVLGDLRVRESIELAIDKKALVDKLLFGKTTVSSSVIPTGWYAPDLQPTAHDPVRARQLLDDAGWRPGSDGVRVKDGVRASLSFGTTTGDRLREQTQQVIQDQLKAVGIEVEIKNSPSAVLLGSWQDNAPRAKGNFDILMWTTNAGIEPQAALYNYFHGSRIPTEETRGGQNFHRIKDPGLDTALEAAGSTLDEAQRKVSYKTVAERVNAEKGHIVLYNRLEMHAFKKYVIGNVPENFWDQFTGNIEDWWLDK